VKVRVRERVPYWVRGAFADYMTNDSKNENNGKLGYSSVKLNFIDDPHPSFVVRPPPKALDEDKGK
jgi:hypothetical protein